MLRRVGTLEGRDIVRQKGDRDCAGILIPYYLPGAPRPHAYRIRRDNPELEEKGGKTKQVAKYLGAQGSANRLYFAPGISPEQLQDVTIPIAITEGEKKALALSRLSRYETDLLRWIAIAIAGVWNWRGTRGKTTGPKNQRVDVMGPIPNLDRIEWRDRTVLIIFDANVHTNEDVKWARSGLCRELTTRGAIVKLVNLPEDDQVNGVDDLLAAKGPAEVLKLFDAAAPGARLHIVPSPQFQSRPEGVFRVSKHGEQLSQTPLTNFRAAIVASIQLDDGVEANREFEIEAEMPGRVERFTIPATEFGKMNWPIERLGAGAIVFPNQRDYARAAIQSYSLTALEKRVFTHTGWRKIDGVWIYLHAGGAISPAGAMSNADVRLSGSLSRYDLRPAITGKLKEAVRASLLLVELGPSAITFPLLAATIRAVFGDADFALHLSGETGAFKSELAALLQQHFGSGMRRLNLPAAWSSTGNALEMLAFHAKDALLVIDDFAPEGSAADVARLHAVADRVLRAAGNHAGRGRLDATARLREQKPPRALILSTGEEIPRGHSLRARLLILELSRGDIDARKLTECQRNAADGLYAQAMAGFLQGLAGSYDEAWASFEAKIAKHRRNALSNPAHARTPEIVASLQAAFEMYLEFAQSTGAIDEEQRTGLEARSWEALRKAAAAQAKHQQEAEPTARYISLLRSVLSSGRAHLEERSGGEPKQQPGSSGWRRDNAGRWERCGDCIG